MRVLAVGMILCLTLSACSGSGSTAPGPSAPIQLANGSMSAQIDGSPFHARFLAADSVAEDPLFSPTPLFVVTGSGASTRIVKIAVPAPAAAGTYAADQSNVTFTVLEGEFGNQLWRAASDVAGSSGSVTFTTLTANHATGTFSFTAVAFSAGVPPKAVTAGTFDVTF